MEKSLSSLLADNWYIEPDMKTAILAKEKAGDYSPEKIERLKDIVSDMNQMQEDLIEEIVAKDPLFFAEFDHELQHEAFEKIKASENPEHQAELAGVEAELEAFLKED